ncbi:protein MAIN-LIKE 2-like [Papaver somniferum]|uniref:protein MAIN-LIKE 2-like n=1 Tax=Papaver somniferum TaxID=3469 RepID=UPI000E6FAB29|nr:protein MAIN-LIKE 2-like [Papaver somniferum]
MGLMFRMILKNINLNMSVIIFFQISKMRRFVQKARRGNLIQLQLNSYFVPKKLREAENDKAIAERVATAFFMYVLGQFLFSNAKNYIDVGWLAAFEDLDAVSTYDWGVVAFSRLYAALRIAGRKRKSLSGPFQVLEFWGYEYLGICAPELVQPSG